MVRRHLTFAGSHVRTIVLTVIGLLSTLPLASAQEAPVRPEWPSWSAELFSQAARDKKFVYLVLRPGWCNGCEAREVGLYANDAVSKLIAKSYRPVIVDRDARPDLANRFPAYNQTATVIFNWDGTEILQFSGYIPPFRLEAILQAVIDDPSPGPSATVDTEVAYVKDPVFTPQLLDPLRRELAASYHTDEALSTFATQLIDADSVEYASLLARGGNQQQQQIALDKLRLAQRLLDPVWGGTYHSLVLSLEDTAAPGKRFSRFTRVQFAREVDDLNRSWNRGQFEKPLFLQAQALQMYARAYAQWRKPEHLAAARGIQAYVRNFLLDSSGAFYAGQEGHVTQQRDTAAYFAMDAAQRRAVGVPQVYQNLYARENGWMISALCQLYGASGDPTALREAERAAQWLIAQRSLPNGGFAHGAADDAGPFLGDTVAVGQAFLMLYSVTGERTWLQRAEQAVHFVAANFAVGEAGFVTSSTPVGLHYKPQPARSENLQLARFAHLLNQYTGSREVEQVTTRALRYLATADIASAGKPAGVLLVDLQVNQAPKFMTILGSKQDVQARELFQAALRIGLGQQRIEWWDPAAGRGLRTDIAYPTTRAQAAAFLCDRALCSAPIMSAAQLEAQGVGVPSPTQR
jgi:uncharacterized protein YyaL (SSP411 family)